MSQINVAALQHVRGLREALAQGFKPTEPITLSSANQFVANEAALVFVSPHVIDASKDIATFGDTEVPPHAGARVVAWFRAPKEVKYVVDFFCHGSLAIHSEEPGPTSGEFTLVPSTGGSEIDALDLRRTTRGDRPRIEEIGVGVGFVPARWKFPGGLETASLRDNGIGQTLDLLTWH
jgi:hypothetical protein